MPSEWKINSRSHSYPPYTPHTSSTGSRFKSPHHPTRTCSSFSLPSKMDFLSSNTNSPHQSENTTSSGSTYTAVMALSSTRTALSFHPHWDRPASLPYMLPIRAPRQWQQKQKHQSSGLASRTTYRPPEQIASTATGWPHPKQLYHPHLPLYQSTRSSAYVQTTSTTKVTLTSSLLTVTLTGP